MFNARPSRYFESWLGRHNYSVDGMRPFGAAFFSAVLAGFPAAADSRLDKQMRR